MLTQQYKELIQQALKEDLAWGDITTASVLSGGEEGSAIAVAKSDLMVAGSRIFMEVFRQVDGNLQVEHRKEDGEFAVPGETLTEISGNLAAILKAERTALNIFQRLCGIATETRRFVDAVDGTRAAVTDTRKTLPGFRMLDKYAVSVGGGKNHRFCLSDGVLIKDNHIDAAGGIDVCVCRCRERIHHLMKIEVECRTLEDVREALRAGADVLMLDNMSLGEMGKAVEIIKGRAVVEASGNVSLQNIREIAETGVDLISVGSITHSVKSADISLLIRKKGTPVAS